EKEADPPKPADVPEPPAVAGEPVIPAEAGIQPAAQARVVLPPVDSLTIDSDFSPFMQPGVDPGLKREALKKLVRDPRFNVMDGLDVYIDDYSKPDPLPEGWLEKLNQVKYLGVFQPQEPATAAEGQPVAVAGATAPEEALAAPETHTPRQSSNGAAQATL